MTCWTDDAVLGGRLVLRQPVAGDRAGMDPILLAASVPARAGESVLDLGCGSGAAILALGVRVPGLRLIGVERDAGAAGLARANAARAGLALEVIEADLAALRAPTVDRVIANPPYFGPGTPARDPQRAAARHEATPLPVWIDAALRRLRPGGRLTLILRADRLGDALAALAGRAGDVAVLPVAARAGRDAGRVLVAARKGARGSLRLRAPFVLHARAAHLRDGEDLTREAQAVLRHAAAIPLEYNQNA